MSMTSSRPYLVRALNEWIIDNQCTPYIVVDATVEGVQVPQEYVSDGQIILNITPGSVRNLLMDNEGISFDARFKGHPHTLYAPIHAITAIYAKENGQGMVFGPESGPSGPPSPKGPSGSKSGSEADKSGAGEGRPRLKVVK